MDFNIIRFQTVFVQFKFLFKVILISFFAENKFYKSLLESYLTCIELSSKVQLTMFSIYIVGSDFNWRRWKQKVFYKMLPNKPQRNHKVSMILGNDSVILFLSSLESNSCQYAPWKHHASWIFQGVYKETSGMKWANSFMTKVPIIQKPVHWFALQINGLVSIW